MDFLLDILSEWWHKTLFLFILRGVGNNKPLKSLIRPYPITLITLTAQNAQTLITLIIIGWVGWLYRQIKIHLQKKRLDKCLKHLIKYLTILYYILDLVPCLYYEESARRFYLTFNNFLQLFFLTIE